MTDIATSADAQLPADPVLDRLDKQQAYYSKNATAAKNAFKYIKMIEIVAAAIIPFLSGQITKQWAAVSYVVGALGVLITILEGLLHLNQYQENWTNYRNTSESLKHEKFLYLAKAGPYATAADPRAMLAERVEALVSQENTQWVAALQKTAQAAAPKSGN
jgi:hypothetical protein